MLAKNLPVEERWWKIPFRMILDIMSAFKGLLSGDGGYFISIMKAHLAFIYWLFSKNKNAGVRQKKLANLKGLYNGNVVWQHFVKKKSCFSQIVTAE